MELRRSFLYIFGVAWIFGWSQQWHLGNPGVSWLNNVLVK